MSSSPAAAAQILRDLAKPDAGLVARFEAYTEPLQQRAAGMMSAKARKKRGRDDAQRFGSFLIKVAHQALQVARLPREGMSLLMPISSKGLIAFSFRSSRSFGKCGTRCAAPAAGHA